MLEHEKKHTGKRGHGKIHQVDRDTYQEFGDAMGWTDPPYFEPCRPTLRGDAPVRDAREKLIVKGLRLEPPKRDARCKESRHKGTSREQSPLPSTSSQSNSHERSSKAKSKEAHRKKRSGSPSPVEEQKKSHKKSKAETVVKDSTPQEAQPPLAESISLVRVETVTPSSTQRPPADRRSQAPISTARLELISGAAMLRQQASQFRLQAQMAEAQARLAEEQATRMEAAARQCEEDPK